MKNREEQFFALDLETSQWSPELANKSKLEFKFGYLLQFDEEFKIINEHYFEKIDSDFLDLILGTKEVKKYIYVHNLDFDFLFLVKSLMDMEKFLVSEIKTSGKIIEIRIKEKAGFDKVKGIERYRVLTIFRNTFCLWSSSLKEIGQNIGIQKLENDKKFENITEQDKAYCRRDCEIIVRFLEFWKRAVEHIYDLVGIPFNRTLTQITLTITSVAKKIFLDYNNQNPRLENKILTSYDEFDEKFRQYYFGGRTEVFDFNFEGKSVVYYDINSMYPYICVNYKLPYGRFKMIEGFVESKHTIGYIANVIENEKIPLIPIREGQKVLFTNGLKKNVLLQKEEYEYLLTRKNTKIQVLTTILSLQEYLFPYFKELYKLRQEYKKNKNPFHNVLKLVMNSSYGFMGINKDREEIVIEEIEEINKEEMNLEEINNLEITENSAYTIQKKEKHIKSIENNVFIATRITALARLTLTKIIHELTDNGYKVYYCDTDSIMAEESPIFKKYHGNELGQMKLEKEGVCYPFAPKMYLFFSEKDEDIKLKGANCKNLKEFFDYTEDGILSVRPCKIKGMVNNGVNEPFQINMIKKMQSFFDKRIVKQDGTTEPINEFGIEGVELKNKEILEDWLKEVKKKVLENGL